MIDPWVHRIAPSWFGSIVSTSSPFSVMRPCMRVPRGKQPHQAEADRRLPAPGLAGQTQHLAPLDRQVDAANRRHRTGLGLVLDRQVAHLEQAHR